MSEPTPDPLAKKPDEQSASAKPSPHTPGSPAPAPTIPPPPAPSSAWIWVFVVVPIVLAIIGAVNTYWNRSVASVKDTAVKPIESRPASSDLNLKDRFRYLSGGIVNQVDVNSDGAAVISATCSASATGKDFRSYLDLVIKVGDHVEAQTRSYVPANWVIGHVVNATCSIPVKKGNKLKIELTGTGEGVEKIAATGTYVLIPEMP